MPELPKSSVPAGWAKPADADAVDTPGLIAGPLHARAERTHGIGGVQDVLAFQQPADGGFADRQGAQNQSAVRDRLVAGHPDASLDRAALAGGQRR